MFGQLHSQLDSMDGGRFHTLSQGLRKEVERVSKESHHWESYNVDQLVRHEGLGVRVWNETKIEGGGGESKQGEYPLQEL